MTTHILHLSDLHFGNVENAHNWYNQLAEDLTNGLDCHCIEVLILSGDIANKSTPDEYKAATYFLKELCKEFKIESDCRVIVPGNHDLNWTLSEKTGYELMYREDYEGDLQEEQFIEINNKIIQARNEEGYKQRFAHFCDFYKTVKEKSYPLEYSNQNILHHIPKRNLLILGLNSAWQIDHYFKNRAAINPNAISNALTKIRKQKRYNKSFKFAVFHHPLNGQDNDRITDHGFMELLASNGFCVCMHGHIHKPETGLFRYDISEHGRKIHIIGAGTFGAPINEWVPGYPLQYNLLELKKNKLTVKSRRRTEINGAWKPDAIWLQGKGEEPSSKYTITLPLPKENIIAWGKSQKAIKVDWGEAPSVPKLYGRENELDKLEKIIIDDRSRLIGIFGMRGSGKTRLIKGGIGKTDLSITIAHKITEEFDYIIWRRLLAAPPIEQILSDFIKFLSDQEEVELPDNLNEQMLLLLKLLQKNRCLLILDNFESILKGGEQLIKYQEDRDGYETLINTISTTDHQSCLVITSREKPYNIEENDFVKIHNLIGLDKEAGKKIFSDIGYFSGTDEAWEELINFYGGNPLSLEFVSRYIKEAFNGNIIEFIRDRPTIIEIEDLITWHFDRLDEPKKEIMYWLAINRDPISKEELKNDIINSKNSNAVAINIFQLERHLPIEKSEHDLISLQPVLLEYMIDRITNKAGQEIKNNQTEFIKNYALVKAQSKKHVRDSQIRQILKPIKEQLEIDFGEQGIENKLYEIIQHQNRDRIPGYTAGNILNFLIYLKSDLTGKDFSSSSIWQAYLQDVELHNVNFSNSNFSRCVFADTFGNIRSVAFSSNGKYLATASVNYEVQLWKFPNAEKIHTFDGHTGAVLCVSFSPDNKMIASGSDDGTIRLWDIEKGKPIRILEGSKSWVMSVAFSLDGKKLASGCEDHTVMIWDIESGKILKTLKRHNDRVGTVAFSSDSKIIASGSEDGTIKLWSGQKYKYLRTLKGHKNRVFSIAFDPVKGSNKLASASEDLTVKIWNIKSGKCLNTMKGHNDRIRGIAYNPDGRNVVSGSQDETLKIWNVETGECIKTLTGHTNRIRSVAYCPPDGQIIASVDDDQTIKLWETKTGHLFESLLGYTSRIKSITFRPESNILAIGNEDRTLKIWDVNSGKCIKNLKGHSGGIWATAFNNNGTILASGSDDRTIKIWDADSGKLIKTLKGHEHRLFSLAFSPDNKLLVSGCEDQSIKIWDIKTWECKKTLKEHDNGVISVAFNSNGSRLASGSDDKTVKILDTKTWKCIKTFKYHSDRVNAVTFNSKGKKLLSGSRDCSIKIWDITKKQLDKTLQNHKKSILCIATNPIDDDIIATGSDDMTIKIWKISTGKCIKSLEDHENSVNSLAFSSNGCLLASGSDDNMIRIWDCKSWQCLKTLRGARIYEDMNITGAKGLIDAQKATLKALGAVDE